MYRIILLLTLSGCATTYYHDTKTEAEYNRDLYECQKVAEQRAANMGNAGNVFMQAGFERECMTMEYGYTFE